jgi:hypothetical protein
MLKNMSFVTNSMCCHRSPRPVAVCNVACPVFVGRLAPKVLDALKILRRSKSLLAPGGHDARRPTKIPMDIRQLILAKSVANPCGKGIRREVLKLACFYCSTFASIARLDWRTKLGATLFSGVA